MDQNSSSKYRQMLINEMLIAVIFIILIFVVALALIVFSIKYKNKILTIGAIIVVLIGSLFMYLFGVFPYQNDIEHNAYETYIGEFTIKDYYYINRGGAYILIKTEQDRNPVRYKVLCDVPEINNNTVYSGTFVYSKTSKCLVDIILE